MHFILPMCPSSTQLGAKQRGSMLIVALFILLVLATLATGLVNMLQRENRTSAYEVFAVRATEAARTGADAMFAQLFPVNAAVKSCSEVIIPPKLNLYLDLSTVEGLQGCEVSTTCRDRVVNLTTYYLITATGKCRAGSGATEFLVERELVAEAKSI